MTWSDLLFAHWRIEPEIVAAMLPSGVTLDTRENMAWIGVVPFQMSNTAPRLCPPLPGLSRFLELNVRTYVSVGGKPGVWFFSLDAASRIAVRLARATFNLPYMDAQMSLGQDEQGRFHYQSQRTHRGAPAADYDASYAPAGEFYEAAPGSLEHWLTARYCLYSTNTKGKILRGEIDHPPWSLAPATYTQRINTLGEGHGIPLEGEPHLLFAQPVDVRAWMATGCEDE